MRKSNPDKVKYNFEDEVKRLRNFLNRVSDLLKGTRHKMADNSQLAQTVFLSTYVAFETFWSDLFLAYLNRDPTHYQREMNERMKQSLEGQHFHNWHVDRIDFSVRQHINKDKIEGIVDPEKRNLTFASAEKMKSKAGSWLNPSHASNINSINDDDERAMDTGRAIRNFITHKSKDSKQEMNSKLDDVDQGGVNSGLGRGSQKVNDVGAFLKAFKNGSRRVVLYQDRFLSIMDKVV
jgi:hypothetical protein